MTDPRLQVSIGNATGGDVNILALKSYSEYKLFQTNHYCFVKQNLAAAGLAGIRNAHTGAFGGIHAAQPGQPGHLPVNTAGLSLQAAAVANQTAAYAGALPAA